MIIVIIAGGSGTRLWPLSQGNRPKHLLSLTGESSLLQNTYGRSHRLSDDIYVVTEQSHAAEVAEQLPELDTGHIIVEPGRRGTASCFVLALAHIARRHTSDEVIVFMHADHHIPDEAAFTEALKAAAAGAAKLSKISLVGIEPSYPATGFGYIQCGDELAAGHELSVYQVKSFKEKPDLATAKQYVKAGNYFWNQGLFAAPLSLWNDQFKIAAPYYHQAYERLRDAPDTDTINRLYLELENETIDYALIEKTSDLVMVPGRYEWADIGSFADLHKVIHQDDGNSVAGYVNLIDCEDSLVYGGDDKPIIAIGLKNIVVVDTPQGLLICAKDQSQKVGDAYKKLKPRQD